jgi:hypothetical protein
MREHGVERIHPCLADRFDSALPAHVIVADVIDADEGLGAAVQAGLARIGVAIAECVAQRRTGDEEHAAPREELRRGTHEIDQLMHDDEVLGSKV